MPPGFRAHSPDTGPSVVFPSSPRERIAIASYPFREFIAAHGEAVGPGKMDIRDFAAHVGTKLAIRKIEPWSQHFLSLEPSYLAQFRAAVERVSGAIANIAADGRNCQYAADPSVRQAAVDFAKRWIDVAVAIGSPSVRTNIPTAKDSKPDVPRAAETLSRVAEYGAAKNIVVHLENDNPVSEDPFFIAQIIDKVNSPWLHALPDFANTIANHPEDYAYKGIQAMFAHSYGICHVKEVEADEQGHVFRADLQKTFGYLKAADYKGFCSIEWDSPGDPYQGTRDLIEKTIRYLS